MCPAVAVDLTASAASRTGGGGAAAVKLPDVAVRVVEAARPPGVTARQLQELFCPDPALAAAVLRLANSGIYGVCGQIGCVERAGVLLGINAVRNLTLAAASARLFAVTPAEAGSPVPLTDLWTHSVAVAAAARALAARSGAAPADDVFLAGLFHDVGLLLSLRLFPSQIRTICDASTAGGRGFCDVERVVLGVDHAALGASLAEQWQLPGFCKLAAGYHHRPADVTGEHRRLVALVHAADVLCCRASIGFSLTAARQPVDPVALDDLQLGPALTRLTSDKLADLTAAALCLFA